MTVKANKVMDISNEIMDRFGFESGTQMASQPARALFINAVARKVGKLDEKDMDVLEDENYHTETELIIKAGLLSAKAKKSRWGQPDEGVDLV